VHQIRIALSARQEKRRSREKTKLANRSLMRGPVRVQLIGKRQFGEIPLAVGGHAVKLVRVRIIGCALFRCVSR
jgi:hypothetical protein